MARSCLVFPNSTKTDTDCQLLELTPAMGWFVNWKFFFSFSFFKSLEVELRFGSSPLAEHWSLDLA
jgi:hypothetical protein